MVSVYHTKGNMNLIAESFQRNLLIKELKVWLISNHKYFKSSKKQKPTLKPSETNEDTNSVNIINESNNN
jgi:hypothetical protein